MQMNGMGIFSEVVDMPLFRGIEIWSLGGGRMPGNALPLFVRIGFVFIEVPQQRLQPSEFILAFKQGNFAYAGDWCGVTSIL